MSDTPFSVIDLNAAQRELALDAPTIMSLVEEFHSSQERFLLPIREAMGQMRLEDVRRGAHRLKGAAYNLRVDRVGEEAQALERAAQERDPERCAGLLDRIEELFGLIAEDLEAARHDESAN